MGNDVNEAKIPRPWQYSTQQPEMCRFLLASGADVDHVGGNPLLGQEFTKCAHNS